MYQNDLVAIVETLHYANTHRNRNDPELYEQYWPFTERFWCCVSDVFLETITQGVNNKLPVDFPQQQPLVQKGGEKRKSLLFLVPLYKYLFTTLFLLFSIYSSHCFLTCISFCFSTVLSVFELKAFFIRNLSLCIYTSVTSVCVQFPFLFYVLQKTQTMKQHGCKSLQGILSG